MNALVIVGAGGHGKVVTEIARRAGFAVHAFLDASKAGQSVLSIPVFAVLDEVPHHADCLIAIALGANWRRLELAMRLLDTHPQSRFPPIVDPSSQLASSASIGAGSVVAFGAAIGADTKIGRFCILNTHSSIDHDGVLEDGASIGPGAVLGGAVTVGARSAVCIGATVTHGVSIGPDTVLGGGSFQNKSLGALQVAYGVPAKVIRTRAMTEPYL